MKAKFLKINKIYDGIAWNPLLALFCLGFVTYKHYVVHDHSFSWNLTLFNYSVYFILILWTFLCFYNIKTKGKFVRWVNEQWGIKEEDSRE